MIRLEFEDPTELRETEMSSRRQKDASTGNTPEGTTRASICFRAQQKKSHRRRHPADSAKDPESEMVNPASFPPGTPRGSYAGSQKSTGHMSDYERHA